MGESLTLPSIRATRGFVLQSRSPEYFIEFHDQHDLIRVERFEAVAGAMLGILTLAFFNVVITLPCIWGSFARPSLLLVLAIGWIVYCALLTALEFGVLCAFLGMPGDGEIAFIFYVMNLAQCGTVFGVLLLLRAVGFRFVRVPLRTYGTDVGQPP